MTWKQPSRRDVLKTASAMVAATSVAGLAGRRARATDAKLAGGAVAPIDQALGKAVEAKLVPHVVAIGATDKGIVYEGAFGTQSMDGGPEVSPDSLFWIASMTKAITATACMQLVEQGKLQLDQTDGRAAARAGGAEGAGRLRRLRRADPAAGQAADHAPPPSDPHRRLRLQHLGRAHGSVREGHRHPVRRRVQERSFKAPIMFDPGERWEYGINIDWVGKAVEAVSDQSLEVYFREHIFEPLDMPDTGFLISTAQKARVATMYSRKDDGASRIDAVRDAAAAGVLHGRRRLCSARRGTTCSSCRCCCTTAPSTAPRC